MNDGAFPQPKRTRSELRKMLHALIDDMIDRLPLGEDRDSQASGYIDLANLSLVQTRAFERVFDESPDKDAIAPNLNKTLKIEIFPVRIKPEEPTT